MKKGEYKVPRKIDVDATTGNKLLRLFRKLMISHGKHYMSDLARELKCSPQTIGRLMLELETELGAQIESGMDSHKKWYKFTSRNSNNLGLDTEEIRYLSLCKDMAAPYLSEDISVHLDQLILKLAIQQLGEDRVEKEYPKIFEPDYSFYSKGQIDYSQHVNSIIKIERAIRESGILKLTYRSSKSNRKKHIYFAPKQFICHSSALYILGASVKDDLKTFEKIMTLLVHRIESVEKTDNKAEFVIPKSASKPSLDSLSVNTVYKIKIADYVINPPDTFSLANTWNNGTKPTLKEQKMVVVQILGKMVKVKSLDEEWTGWLPMKSIEQFSIIGGV